MKVVYVTKDRLENEKAGDSGEAFTLLNNSVKCL